VYGNREYEDALRELQDLVTELGFIPIAGGTFVGEHSWHSETTPIAAGRPDALDLRETQRFGTKISEQIGEVRTTSELTTFKAPGGVPYKDFKPPSGLSPESNGFQTMPEQGTSWQEPMAKAFAANLSAKIAAREKNRRFSCHPSQARRATVSGTFSWGDHLANKKSGPEFHA